MEEEEEGEAFPLLPRLLPTHETKIKEKRSDPLHLQLS